MTKLSLLFLVAIVAAQAQTTPILVDTDAGSDDFMAVALLLSQPVRLDAITIANGLAHVDVGARNMGRLLDLAGRPGIPVFAGRSSPLRGKAEFPAEWRKSSDDLPGVQLPAATRKPESKVASAYLVERLRKGPPVRILALGPLTNLAEALKRDRTIAANIREIVIMGGAVKVPGNLGDGGAFKTKNTSAEWNIFVDPLAASIVFRSGIPIRLIALDATNKVPIGKDFLHEFEGRLQSPLGRVVAGVLKVDQASIDEGIFYAWDPLAAAALLRPAVVKTVPLHISVLQESLEDGRTAATAGRPNVDVAMDADRAAFLAFFLDSLTRMH